MPGQWHPSEDGGECLCGSEHQVMTADNVGSLMFQYGIELGRGKQLYSTLADDDARTTPRQAVCGRGGVLDHGGMQLPTVAPHHVQDAAVAGARPAAPGDMECEAKNQGQKHSDRKGDGHQVCGVGVPGAHAENNPAGMQYHHQSCVKVFGGGYELVGGQSG